MKKAKVKKVKEAKVKKVKIKDINAELNKIRFDEYKWVLDRPMYVEKNDERYSRYCDQLKKVGFSDTETWSLDSVVSSFILPRLKRFRDITNGYPGGVEEVSTPEKWKEVLDKMIFAFEWNLMCEEEVNYNLSDEEKDANWKKYSEGLDLFAKYFRALWW